MSNERVIEYTTIKLELDEVTTYSDHKKNRFSGNIKSIRVGRASSPNAIFKVKLKEGDEIQLWPGRIINFSEKSLGAVFSWDSLPNEWAEIEISENTFFVAGDSHFGSGGSGGVAKEFRRSSHDLIRFYQGNPVFAETIQSKKILSQNDKRLYAIIENPNPEAIFVGKEADIDNSISSLIRLTTSIRIMPFSKKKIPITGELFAIRDTAFSRTQGKDHRIIIEEYLL